MIYKFRIISDEKKDFARELLIDSEQTFLDFHHCIQEDLEYDAKQLASFFLTTSGWEKQLQITLMDMMDEEGDICLTMEQARLCDYLSSVGQRLLYVFDFFSERSFFMELTDILKISDCKVLPKIIFSHGEAPLQIDLGLVNLTFPDDEFTDELNFDSLDDDLSDFSDDFGLPDSDDYSDD